jgi:hypothetical protein
MVLPEHCPVKTILCKDLLNAVDIKRILAGYSRLSYELFTLREVIKYGQSAYERDGERIYRQIWQFPGWPTVPSANAAGSDILDVVHQRPNLHKNDLAVRVWDLSNIPCQNRFAPHKETIDVENELLRRYIAQYKCAPIGNKLEQQKLSKGLNPIKSNMTVAPGLLDNLFSIEF